MIYQDKAMNVRPFFIAPCAKTDQELRLVFGSKDVQEKLDDITSIIVNMSRLNICRLTPVIIKNKKSIIVANCYRSNALDRQTKRGGLFFIYGAVVCDKYIAKACRTCGQIFSVFNEFIEREYSFKIVNNFDPVLDAMQNIDLDLNEIVSAEGLNLLLMRFESDFFLCCKTRHVGFAGFFLRRKINKMLNKIENKCPCCDMEAVANYWKFIDDKLDGAFCLKRNNDCR